MYLSNKKQKKIMYKDTNTNECTKSLDFNIFSNQLMLLCQQRDHIEEKKDVKHFSNWYVGTCENIIRTNLFFQTSCAAALPE
jgi:hypothetical protein